MKNGWISGAVAMFGVALMAPIWGCASSVGKGSECSTDADCRNGQMCSASVCVAASSNDAGSRPPAPQGGDSGAACSVGDRQFTLPTCGACLQSNCCTELAACADGSDCRKLERCLDGCNGDSTCENVCAANFSGGVTAYKALNSCALDETTCRQACRPKNELGYPCRYDADCLSGSCAGNASSPGWCTASCASNADCGSGNVCAKTKDGTSWCFASCSSTAQCQQWFGNTSLSCNGSYLCTF